MADKNSSFRPIIEVAPFKMEAAVAEINQQASLIEDEEARRTYRNCALSLLLLSL